MSQPNVISVITGNNRVCQGVSNRKNALWECSQDSDVIFSSLMKKKQKTKGWQAPKFGGNNRSVTALLL